MEEHDKYLLSLLKDLEYVHENGEAPDISIENVTVSDVLQSVRENFENIQNYEYIDESASFDNFQDHYHHCVNANQSWAEASSHNERAWAVDPTRAQCGLGTYYHDEITKTNYSNDLEYIDCETPDISSENSMASDVSQNLLQSLESIQNDENIPESDNSDNFHDEISITGEKNDKREANIHICKHCGGTFEEKSKLTAHITAHNISGGARKDELFCNTRLAAKNLDLDTSNSNINYESIKKCDSNTAKNCDKMHTQNISNQKTYECSKCDLIFSTYRSLIAHNNIHPEDKPHKCAICFSSFMQKGALKTHMITHIVGKPYECNICNSKFTRKSNLNVHMIRHTGNLPYKCSLCNNKFVSTSHLKIHMRRHVGEKPHKCTVCNKKFVTNAELVAHRRVHTLEKPYKCTVCDSTFKSIKKWKNHMNIHTKEKPYGCTVYDYKFVTNN